MVSVRSLIEGLSVAPFYSLLGNACTPKIEGEEPYGANAAYQQVLSSWLTCREKVSFLDKTLLFLQHSVVKVFLKLYFIFIML